MDDDRIPANVWGLTAILLVGGFPSMATSTVVNVALDALSRQFSAPLATVQWTASGYLLAMAATVPVSGWAARRFGAGRVWIAGIGIFALASAFCALAPNIELLIVARILLGMTGGLLVPVGQMMVATIAGPRRMGRLMAVASVPLVLAPVLGSTVGGARIVFAGLVVIVVGTVPLALIGPADSYWRAARSSWSPPPYSCRPPSSSVRNAGTEPKKRWPASRCWPATA
ncbi:MFS transporter [Fodinicola acaciae]|uniref:MFS transporter n=1 Tax=Fodinicola acaciae TaxID=2681555 RepID=UPI001C9E8FCD|nr:MFS transporter [Fodinicola acaciae]